MLVAKVEHAHVDQTRGQSRGHLDGRGQAAENEGDEHFEFVLRNPFPKQALDFVEDEPSCPPRNLASCLRERVGKAGALPRGHGAVVDIGQAVVDGSPLHRPARRPFRQFGGDQGGDVVRILVGYALLPDASPRPNAFRILDPDELGTFAIIQIGLSCDETLIGFTASASCS